MDTKLLIVTVCAILCSSLSACDDVGSWPEVKFDSKSWKAADEGNRYIYVRSLMAEHFLIGKLQGDVIKLLGEPSSRDPSSASIQYFVKHGGRGFSQVFVLDVLFDGPRGDVATVRIRGD